MSVITGGELLARAMQAEGIEIFFGLPSPEIDPLFAQFEKHGIRLVPMRHEAAAVHMAEGYYKTTGKVAAVLGNPGPGSANLIPGVTTALHEGVPVLALSSQHRLGIAYPSTPATFQGQDQVEMFRPVVKWSAPLLQWERIPELVRIAFREMFNGRPGPVHIDLPAPLMYEERDESEAPVVLAGASRADGPRAGSAQLAEARGAAGRGQAPGRDQRHRRRPRLRQRRTAGRGRAARVPGAQHAGRPRERSRTTTRTSSWASARPATWSGMRPT